MKKSIFGLILFLTGCVGYLIFSLYLSAHPVLYNGVAGTRGALLGNDLMLPYTIFCVMGITGLIICVYETFLRKK